MQLLADLQRSVSILFIVAAGLVAARVPGAAAGPQLLASRAAVSDPDLMIHACPEHSLPADQVVGTQRLSAGWNLVSGPFGSCLRGATGPVYGPYLDFVNGDGTHVQDYRQAPSNYPLVFGSGYWAYFPDGGSIELTTGGLLGRLARLTDRAGPLPPGMWQLLGNPSPDAAAVVEGAAAVLTYTPAAGYQTVDAIPPGQGAWVLGGASGMARLHASSATDSGYTLPAPHPVIDGCGYPGAVTGIHHVTLTDDQARIGRAVALADQRVTQVANGQPFTTVKAGSSSLLDPTCDGDILMGAQVEVTWAQPSTITAGAEWPQTIVLLPPAAQYFDRPYLDAVVHPPVTGVCALSIVVDVERQRVIELDVSPLNSDVCAHRLSTGVANYCTPRRGDQGGLLDEGAQPSSTPVVACLPAVEALRDAGPHAPRGGLVPIRQRRFLCVARSLA